MQKYTKSGMLVRAISGKKRRVKDYIEIEIAC